MEDSDTSEPKPTDPILDPAPQDQESSAMSLKLPLRPTAAYLAIAHSPSLRTSLAQAPRKLLILDLNGTLLLRPKPRNARHRPIHPRPYMLAFRSYLFHEAVKPWLEVRVWSSAQPHSVKDMVERCFADRRGDLKAVWARDTLGLKAAEYSRKVQTTKDLAKHWSVPPVQHSAKTTLLLDDSPLKAHLQPYNHFCVPEYTQNLRNRDLIAKENIARREEFAEVHLGGWTISTAKRRKRKPQRTVVQDTACTEFDPTLLAVIGVLDEVKEQTNVAGWIRAGGLWAGQTPPQGASSSFELFSDSEGSCTGDLSARRRTRSGTEPGSPSTGNPGNDAVLGGEEVMWFDHKPCLEYWVDRGTHAVEALGIDLGSGVDR